MTFLKRKENGVGRLDHQDKLILLVWFGCLFRLNYELFFYLGKLKWRGDLEPPCPHSLRHWEPNNRTDKQEPEEMGPTEVPKLDSCGRELAIIAAASSVPILPQALH